MGCVSVGEYVCMYVGCAGIIAGFSQTTREVYNNFLPACMVEETVTHVRLGNERGDVCLRCKWP